MPKNTPEEIRAKLQTLDLNREADRAKYRQLQRDFMYPREGYYPENEKCVDKLCGVYEVARIKHVGIGFNMEQEGARKEWASTFGGNAPDFDAVFQGKTKLSQGQIEKLFEHSVDTREDQLKEIYKEERWEKMPAVLRFVVEDTHFNGGYGLTFKNPRTKKHTNFYKQVIDYVDNGNLQALTDLKDNILTKSNARKDEGIQNRRNDEATILEALIQEEEKKKSAEKKTASMPDAIKEAVASAGKVAIEGIVLAGDDASKILPFHKTPGRGSPDFS